MPVGNVLHHADHTYGIAGIVQFEIGLAGDRTFLAGIGAVNAVFDIERGGAAVPPR